MLALLVEPCLCLLIERCLCAPFYEDFEFDFGWLRWPDDFTIHRYVVPFAAPCTRHILIEDWLGLLRQLGDLQDLSRLRKLSDRNDLLRLESLDELLMPTASADADAFLPFRHAAATRVDSFSRHHALTPGVAARCFASHSRLMLRIPARSQQMRNPTRPGRSWSSRVISLSAF